MLSPYTLFCSPYRFEQKHNHPMSRDTVERELLSVVMPGVNFVTASLIRMGLKNNFGIVDKGSLIAVVESLQGGEYQSVDDLPGFIDRLEDEQQKQLIGALHTLTKGRGLQGFDDCRIIDVLTKSYAANLIGEAEFTALFEQQSARIRSDYYDWQQYLASCVLGKLFQICDRSLTVATEEEYITAIYSYCTAPTNIFSFAPFWQSGFDELRALLSELLSTPIPEYEPSDGTAPSAALIEWMRQNYLDPDCIDRVKYPYLSELASYAFWQPIVKNDLDWILLPSGKDEGDLLMPKELMNLRSASEFWRLYDKFRDPIDSEIFVMLDGVLGMKALFAENAVYTFHKKLFSKTEPVPTPWQNAKLTCRIDLPYYTRILLNDKVIFENLDPSFERIGLSKQQIKTMSDRELEQTAADWSAKMNRILQEIPQRLAEFREAVGNSTDS